MKATKLKERLMKDYIVINCKTYLEAHKYMEILDSWSMRWATGCTVYCDNSYKWDEHEENTCYELYKEPRKNLYYSSSDFYKKKGYEIWSFEQFLEEYNKEINN